MTWKAFLRMIDALELNETIVNIDFDDDITISSLWKCSSTSISTSTSRYSHSYYGYNSWHFNKRYILDHGCLKESTSLLTQSAYRLCITDPLTKYSSLTDNDDNSTIFNTINPQIKFCPTNWFDLNGRCYRISDQKKTIYDARNSCITLTESELNRAKESNILVKDDDDDDDDEEDDMDEEQLDQTPRGEIVQYTSEWQARLGFFLLDTIFKGNRI